MVLASPLCYIGDRVSVSIMSNYPTNRTQTIVTESLVVFYFLLKITELYDYELFFIVPSLLRNVFVLFKLFLNDSSV